MTFERMAGVGAMAGDLTPLFDPNNKPATPQEIEAASKSTHALFGPLTLEDADYVMKTTGGVSVESEAQAIAESGEYPNEVVVAMAQMRLVEAEQKFFRMVRGQAAPVKYDWNQDASLSLHTEYAMEYGRVLLDLIEREMTPNHNTIIVSPTGLVFLQAAAPKDGALKMEAVHPTNEHKVFGRIGNCKVVIDTYADDDFPILIGRVEVNPLHRSSQYNGRKLMMNEKALLGWKSIPVESNSLGPCPR